MNSLVDILITAGALEPQRPTNQERQERRLEAAKQRSAKIQTIKSAAKKNGEDPPEFIRGRPKKYHTDEERKLAQRAHNNDSNLRAKEKTELVRQGLEQLVSANAELRSPAITNVDGI